MPSAPVKAVIRAGQVSSAPVAAVTMPPKPKSPSISVQSTSTRGVDVSAAGVAGGIGGGGGVPGGDGGASGDATCKAASSEARAVAISVPELAVYELYELTSESLRTDWSTASDLRGRCEGNEASATGRAARVTTTKTARGRGASRLARASIRLAASGWRGERWRVGLVVTQPRTAPRVRRDRAGFDRHPGTRATLRSRLGIQPLRRGLIHIFVADLRRRETTAALKSQLSTMHLSGGRIVIKGGRGSGGTRWGGGLVTLVLHADFQMQPVGCCA